MERMLTTGEVAKLLGVHIQTARRTIDKEIEYIRFSEGGNRRVPESKLREYLTERNIEVDWSVLES